MLVFAYFASCVCWRKNIELPKTFRHPFQNYLLTIMLKNRFASADAATLSVKSPRNSWDEDFEEEEQEEEFDDLEEFDLDDEEFEKMDFEEIDIEDDEDGDFAFDEDEDDEEE